MSEPVKKPDQQPESYQPKKPEMMRALEGAQVRLQPAYPVLAANGGSYIDGVPTLKWGEFKDCTYSGCVALWLNVMGVNATYEQVAGLTGSCYRLSMCYGWDPGSCIMNTSYSLLKGFADACGADDNANRAFGFEFYTVEDEAERDEKVQKSIDSGIPVLALGGTFFAEWNILTGYEKTEGGIRYFGRSYFDGFSSAHEFYTNNRYALANRYPGEYPGLFLKLCNQSCEPTPSKEALKRSLETCLIMFGAPKTWKSKRLGYGAYKFMIDSLKRDRYYNSLKKTTKYKDVEMHFSNLLDARRAAHIYLAESAPLLSGENRARLLRVAAMYKEMFDVLSAVLPYEKLCNNEFEAGLSAELRQEIIGALQKMILLEKQARVIVRKILADWEDA